MQKNSARNTVSGGLSPPSRFGASSMVRKADRACHSLCSSMRPSVVFGSASRNRVKAASGIHALRSPGNSLWNVAASSRMAQGRRNLSTPARSKGSTPYTSRASAQVPSAPSSVVLAASALRRSAVGRPAGRGFRRANSPVVLSAGISAACRSSCNESIRIAAPSVDSVLPFIVFVPFTSPPGTGRGIRAERTQSFRRRGWWSRSRSGSATCG